MSMFCSGRELLTVRDAARWIESQTTVKPSVETIHRWMRRGVRGRMLPSRQIGGVWYVSHDDLAAFIEAGDKRQTSGPAPTAAVSPAPRPSPHRREQLAESEAKLRRKLGRTT